MKTKNILIRHAGKSEAPLILKFIRKKAAFDASMKAFNGTVQTSEEAIRETLLGPVSFARALFAEVGGVVEAFALYYFRYSSFKGRPHLWLDDLYVNESARRQGLGTAMIGQLAQIAVTNHCSHMAWTASCHNVRGMRFYDGLGAEVKEIIDKKAFVEMDESVLFKISQASWITGIRKD